MMTEGEVLLLLLLACLFLLGGLALIALPSYQAYRRGYNPIVWGIAAILALNPIFLLVVLVLAPHRSRLRLRHRFIAELDAKLARRAPPARPAGTLAVDATAPTATGSRQPGSPGGRPTDVSATRSIESGPKDPRP
jgi:hypothetical protein